MSRNGRIPRRGMQALVLLAMAMGSALAQTSILSGVEIGNARDSGSSSTSYRMPAVRVGGSMEGEAGSPNYRLKLSPNRFSRDDIAPKVVITWPGQDTLVNIRIFPVSYAVDADPYRRRIYTLQDGLNVLVIDTTDAAGNRGADTLRVTLDTFAPVVEFLQPEQEAVLTASPVEATIRVDGSLETRSFNLAEGFNLLSVSIGDAAGNVTVAERPVRLDSRGPEIAVLSPQPGSYESSPIALRVALQDTGSGMDANSIGLELDGQDILADVENQIDSLIGSLRVGNGSHTLRISARDRMGNLSQRLVEFTYQRPVPAITITSPENLSTLRTADVLVTGTLNRTVTQVLIGGVPATVEGNTFRGLTPLTDGRNTILVTGIEANGAMATSTVTLTLDREKPRIYIASPKDGYRTSAPSLRISGSVTDRIADAQDLAMPSVTLNGVPVPVENFNFSGDVDLAPGENVITAVATDRAGNYESSLIRVHREEPGTSILALEAGQQQTGTVLASLPAPLRVSLKDGAGVPLAGRQLVFKVSLGDGSFPDGRRVLTATTDASGEASVAWTLGSRSGPGGNQVTVAYPEAGQEVHFGATALPLANRMINAASGEMQRGVAGALAPHPLAAIVTDLEDNPIGGLDVVFRVKDGGGHFAGQDSVVVRTGADGRATAGFFLGPHEGRDNNVVEATFAGNPGQSALFILTGYIPGPLGQTRVTGVVVDNSNLPLPGVTVRIEGSGQQALTDAQGRFVIAGAPIGNLHLFVDGSTSTRPGDWVTLMFEMNSISGKDNDLGMPIYLVERNNAEGRVASASQDQIVTLTEIPGFSLRVPAGSAIFPPDMEDHTVTVTQVHTDKIPMPPGEGMQPRFIISIGPPQVKFDPPAPITYPNVDGLRPGEQTHFYSFDHDLGTYVSIGTGTVSEDGTTITSDKGFGIVKGGWHCAGPRQQQGQCEKCDVDVVRVGPKVVAQGDNLAFAATTKGSGTLSWSGGSSNVHCNSGGEKTKSATYNCTSGESDTDSDMGVCVAVTSISPKACNWFKVNESESKADFNITTVPDGYANSNVVTLNRMTSGTLWDGQGTAIVEAAAGTSSAQTQVNVYDPNWKRKETFLGWDLKRLSDFLKGLEKLSGGCRLNVSGEFYVEHSKKLCPGCELKPMMRVGGSVKGGIQGCKLQTPPFPAAGGLVQVRGIVPWGVDVIGKADVGTSCEEETVCFSGGLAGTLGVGGAVCVGTCEIVEGSVTGQGTITFDGFKYCTDGEFVGPTLKGVTASIKGVIKTNGFTFFSFEQTVDLRGAFD